MQTIDLISFLQDYYQISHEDLSFRTLTHEDVADLFPYVTKSDKRSITTENITCGNVIGVYDKRGKVVYYSNPHLEFDSVDIEFYDEDKELEDKTICVNLSNLENLSKEELLSIRRKLRLNNQRKDSYMINALIRKMKQKEPKYYREKKEKILIKERMNYND